MNTLENFRREIDLLDSRIIEAIGSRLEVRRQIAHLKREQFIPMMQHGRIEEVRRHCAELCAEHGVSTDLADAIYRLIISESCRIENEIIDAPAATAPVVTGRPVPIGIAH